MKFVKKVMLLVLVAFVGIQFIPTTRNQSNELLETDYVHVLNVPSDIQDLLKRSCYDCHSNNTHYPFYSKIQPFGWWLEDHVKKGKEDLNFSEFGAYSKRRQKSKLKSTINQIRDNEMPLSSYTLIHRDAKLSESDKKRVIEWVYKVLDSLYK